MNSVIAVLVLYLQYNVNGIGQWTSWVSSGCSVTCGQGQKFESRRCVKTIQNTTLVSKECVGSRKKSSPCVKLNCPDEFEERVCNCGCKMAKNTGRINSKMKNKKSLQCVWEIETDRNSEVHLRISNFKGSMLIITDDNGMKKYVMPVGNSKTPYPITVASSTNLMNVSMFYDQGVHSRGEISLEATFVGIGGETPVKQQKRSETNLTLVAAISACGVIILIVILIVIYNKFCSTPSPKSKEETSDDMIEDNCSSVSSSRSSRSKNLKNYPASNDEQNSTLLNSEKRLSLDKTSMQSSVNTVPRGLPDGRELYLTQNNEAMQHPQFHPTSQPQMFNWHLPQPGYVVNQSTITYTPQGPMRHQPQLVTYPVG